MEQRPYRSLQHRHNIHTRHHDPNAFFGLDVEGMTPKARVAVGLVVILPILLSAPLFLTVLSDVWWIFMTYAWAVFPAFGILIRGVSGLFDDEGRLPSGDRKEQELLRALREHGELTPARAAMETSLTVSGRTRCSRGWPKAGTWRFGLGPAASSIPCGSLQALRWSLRIEFDRGRRVLTAWYDSRSTVG